MLVFNPILLKYHFRIEWQLWPKNVTTQIFQGLYHCILILGSQRGLIQDEIKTILNYALQWNQKQERKSSRKTLLDAWRQVTEILLCAMPTDQVLSVPGAKQRLILELLQMLLNKVLADGALLGMYLLSMFQ